MIEILTPDWKYIPSNDTSNYAYVVQVKEQRRLGTVRGNTKTIPQAPSIKVRIKADTPNLPENASVKADLWTYGVAFKGRNRHEFIAPGPDGHKLTHLRNDIHIACVDNIARFGEVCPDGYRYAELSCFITRGARVCSRRNHVAFRLSVVVQKEGTDSKNLWDSLCLTNKGKWLSKTQISKLIKPDFGEENIETVVASIPPVRTARMSISEKAMCPRECDQKKRKGTSKRKLQETDVNDSTGSPKASRLNQNENFSDLSALGAEVVNGLANIESPMTMQHKLSDMLSLTQNFMTTPSSLQLLSIPGLAGLRPTYPMKSVETTSSLPMLPFYNNLLGLGNGLNGFSVPVSNLFMTQLAQSLTS